MLKARRTAYIELTLWESRWDSLSVMKPVHFATVFSDIPNSLQRSCSVPYFQRNRMHRRRSVGRFATRLLIWIFMSVDVCRSLHISSHVWGVDPKRALKRSKFVVKVHCLQSLYPDKSRPSSMKASALKWIMMDDCNKNEGERRWSNKQRFCVKERAELFPNQIYPFLPMRIMIVFCLKINCSWLRYN